MNLIFKSILFSLSILIFTQNPLRASSSTEEVIEKPTSYNLTPLHQTKLDLNLLQAEVGKLTRQGFPEKRAREIYAQEQIAAYFKGQDKKLFPAGEILTQMKGTYIAKFNENDEGVLDEVFTVPAIEALEKEETPVIYNETHSVEDVSTVQPGNFKELDPKYIFTPSWTWGGDLTGELKKPCGTINISISLLKCKPLIGIYRRGKLKKRLLEYRLDHNLTTLKADGTLTLFKVERKK